MTRRILGIYIIGVVAAITCLGSGMQGATMDDLRKQALDESVLPIRPGVPGEHDFWNRYSENFIYAPAFDIPASGMAVERTYRFTVHSETDKKDYVFEAGVPYAPLTPIWKDLPCGPATLKVEMISHVDPDKVDLVGTRTFNKKACYKGPYNKPAKPYGESGLWALDFQFKQPHYQSWKDGKRTNYNFNIYPCKMVSAVIYGMVGYAKLAPNNAKNAMQIAENAAKYLQKISYAKGSPFEYFPPTYDTSAYRKPENPKDDWWPSRAVGKIMLIYPTFAGRAFLDLYDATGKREYLESAKRIADTYCKTQLPCGTWPIKAYVETGAPDTDVLLIPHDHLVFFTRLIDQYGLNHYKAARDKALKWVLENPARNFNWQAQFEDVSPTTAYRNLGYLTACGVASYLFDHAKKHPEYVPIAEDIARFTEDQFVVWEPESPTDMRATPCALEQYWCYGPIEDVAIMMAEVWTKAYKVTGKELYREKARAIVNQQTIVQDQITGQYRTYWYKDDTKKNANWDECATLSALLMPYFEKELK
ncbi:MAG: hypothetical protein M1133_05710 [Armatimonadetes bacterium]|nr:hypothetical protein [Armatimonadota bacterium]